MSLPIKIELPETSCTGCGACVQSCKAGAVKMECHNDGFLYPHIDEAMCIKCGQCMKSCHAMDENNLRTASMCYAAQITSEDILKKSTSGGVFYALAQSILSEQGVVYGCIYDDSYHAVIGRADTLGKIAPMHGSKYVWSDSSESYPLVKQDLEAGRKVLYTGVPCQIAGLKKYLKKQYEGLYTVDVLCGGAPSPYAFQKYLETITDEEGKKELHFQFRDKEKYGSGVDCTYYVNGVKHHEDYLKNSFYFSFCSKSRISWRTSCYHCNYKSIMRASDMTIGDYWGVENYHSSYNPKDGVSVILINSCQGEKLFHKIKEKVRFEESQVSYAVEKNSLVNKIEEGHVKVPDNRDAFFDTLHTMGWKTADRKYLGKRKKMLRKQFLYKVYRKTIYRIMKKG